MLASATVKNDDEMNKENEPKYKISKDGLRGCFCEWEKYKVLFEKN